MNNINYSIIINNSNNSTENQILNTEQLLNELNNSLEIKEIIINNELENTEYSNSENDFINYYTYYSVKDLHKILDYYGLPKSKLKKDELIQMIVLYENEYSNIEIVQRRKLMWYYIEELQNDDFMKKYVLF